MGKIWNWLKANNHHPASVLFPPVLAVMFCDLMLTLPGQPKGYWIDFDKSNETNIIGAWLLKVHPLAFIYAFLLYMIIAYLLVTYSKPRLGLALWLTLLVAHSYTAMSWINDVIKDVLKNVPKENVSEGAQILIIDIVVFSLFSYYVTSKALEKFINKPSQQTGLDT